MPTTSSIGMPTVYQQEPDGMPDSQKSPPKNHRRAFPATSPLRERSAVTALKHRQENDPPQRQTTRATTPNHQRSVLTLMFPCVYNGSKNPTPYQPRISAPNSFRRPARSPKRSHAIINLPEDYKTNKPRGNW